MTPSRAAGIAALAAVSALVAWVLFVGLPRWYRTPVKGSTAAALPPPAGRKIKAHLFYVSEDGSQLTSVDRDIAYGEGTIEQAKRIVNAQIAPVTEPLVSAIPAGTKLRSLFVTEQGDAYVDLSPELTAGHSGGSLAEMLTVYTIVQALTANLPAVKAVQLLVNGKEVDTLAGHVDLRRPLVKNEAWIAQ
jgi:spore germination protein GerM